MKSSELHTEVFNIMKHEAHPTGQDERNAIQINSSGVAMTDIQSVFISV